MSCKKVQQFPPILKPLVEDRSVNLVWYTRFWEDAAFELMGKTGQKCQIEPPASAIVFSYSQPSAFLS